MIELLIVLAMISVLAALLFPVFGIAREKTRQSVCGSNLRQVGLSISMYLSDYDGYFPYAIEEWTRYHPDLWANEPFYEKIPRLPAWQTVLFPYTQSKNIFHCPSDFGGRDDTIPRLIPTVFAALGTSYMLDEKMGLFGANESTVTRPAEYVYVYDLGRQWHNLFGNEPWQDAGNCLYYDGHIKFVNDAGQMKLVGQIVRP